MYSRFSIPQILLATLLGAGGGLYIYRPIYEQYYWEQKKSKASLPASKEAEEKND
ncbi:protein PIGBOS1 [Rhinatrema bivittatum]|uniref:protein PIGBOS1 n=1 Tax=Rhinatrema bivittatum TaxID=194408 RepID=UPI00112E8CDD|nr:protein PIGBOS1 [Rhinatrema bivittatum]